MPTVTGIATSFIDFTRASNATVTDSDGKVKWAPHNLLTNSESFDAAAWVKVNTTVSANVSATTAPNGTLTSDKVVETAVTGTHECYQSVSVITDARYTWGAFVKASERTVCRIRCYATSIVYEVEYNLGTVVATDKSGSGSATITALSGGWYYVTATATATASGSGSFSFYLSDGTSVNYAGVAGNGLYLWGASLYRSDLGGMQPNTSAYPMYNPTTPKTLLGYTQDFSNWAKTVAGDTVTLNAATAPNGLQTADLWVADGTSANHRLDQTVSVQPTTGTYSFYAKVQTASAFIQISQSGNNAGWVNFDLVNGTKSDQGTGITGSITSVGNGWYRCSAYNTNSPSANLRLSLVTGLSATRIETAAISSGIYLWGAQLSDSASLDSYVPVYGAAVTSAAYYGPRRDFDPVTLACKGLLVEEQRTNLQLNSNVFGTSTFAATVVAGAAASPSGLIDASSLACTSTSGRAILSTSVTSGIVYTFSVFIKAGTNTSAYIELAGTSGSGGQVVFNLSNGTVTSGTGGAIVPAPNGFYRCSVTSTATGTGASDMRIGTGDATSKTVFVYGAQLEANASFATSYIPVGATSAGATRNADVASVSTQAFPYSATEGTLVANFSFNTGVDIGSYLVQLGGPAGGTSYGSSNSIFRGLNQGLTVGQRLMGLTYDDANSPSYAITAADVNVSPSKVAYGFAANNFGVSVNGATVITDTSGAVPTSATVLTLGSIRGGLSNFLNGHIRQITYLPRRISNTELQTRTA